MQAVDPGFVDAGSYDYHLIAGSTAIDVGTPPGASNDGTDLTPTLQYVDQANTEDRPDDGAIDIGAYEYVAAGPAPAGNDAGADLVFALIGSWDRR